MTAVFVRRGGRTLAGIAAVGAIVLATQALSEEAAMVFSDLVYPLVAIGAGLLIVLGSSTRYERDRVAWILFGIGVVLFGFGEATWAIYELILATEPPFPGLPDFFYLSAYPVFAAAMLVAPRLAADKYQRVQQILDGVVITVGLSMIAWLTIFEPMYAEAANTSLSEFVVGAAYPLGDILLVATVGAVGFRRSFHLRDRALWYVIAALIATAFGDIVYLTQSWAGTYISGSWVDATWLAAYGLFALAAAALPESFEQRQARDSRLPIWYVFIPAAAAVGVLVVDVARRVSIGDIDGLASQIAVTALGLVIVLRIVLTVAEDRHLVDEERKRLISVVSHELRTPLTATQGFLDLVLAGWAELDDAERRDMVEIAQDQTSLVARIVTDLVATTRDNLHATKLDLEVVDVGSHVADLLLSLHLGSEVIVTVDRPATVMADRGRLTQILTNLLANADRYGNGSIECLLKREGVSCELSVHDNGPGVPPQHREGIWEAFDRGPHRFDATMPGSGLGLAIVRSLVKAHGGQIGYRGSERLGGACFWVKLPVYEKPPVKVTGPPALVPTVGASLSWTL